MRSYSQTLLLILLLLVAPALRAQEPGHSSGSDVLARLSYHSFAVSHRDGVHQVCVAVSRDGEYRIVQSMENGLMIRLHGKMPQEQLQELTKLLSSSEFKKLSGNHSGLIRQDAESFAAEIPLGTQLRADGTRKWIEQKAQRVQWLNADGESPFPDSIAKVVDWLEHFQPQEGKSFDYVEFPDVCPSGGLRFVQPALAFNLQRK